MTSLVQATSLPSFVSMWSTDPTRIYVSAGLFPAEPRPQFEMMAQAHYVGIRLSFLAREGEGGLAGSGPPVFHTAFLPLWSGPLQLRTRYRVSPLDNFLFLKATLAERWIKDQLLHLRGSEDSLIRELLVLNYQPDPLGWRADPATAFIYNGSPRIDLTTDNLVITEADGLHVFMEPLRQEWKEENLLTLESFKAQEERLLAEAEEL